MKEEIPRSFSFDIVRIGSTKSILSNVRISVNITENELVDLKIVPNDLDVSEKDDTIHFVGTPSFVLRSQDKSSKQIPHSKTTEGSKTMSGLVFTAGKFKKIHCFGEETCVEALLKILRNNSQINKKQFHGTRYMIDQDKKNSTSALINSREPLISKMKGKSGIELKKLNSTVMQKMKEKERRAKENDYEGSIHLNKVSEKTLENDSLSSPLSTKRKSDAVYLNLSDKGQDYEHKKRTFTPKMERLPLAVVHKSKENEVIDRQLNQNKSSSLPVTSSMKENDRSKNMEKSLTLNQNHETYLDPVAPKDILNESSAEDINQKTSKILLEPLLGNKHTLSGSYKTPSKSRTELENHDYSDLKPSNSCQYYQENTKRPHLVHLLQMATNSKKKRKSSESSPDKKVYSPNPAHSTMKVHTKPSISTSTSGERNPFASLNLNSGYSPCNEKSHHAKDSLSSSTTLSVTKSKPTTKSILTLTSPHLSNGLKKSSAETTFNSKEDTEESCKTLDEFLLSSPSKEETSRIRNGIKNLGQTCFIASTVQLLYNTYLLRKFILALHLDDLNETDVLRELFLLFKQKSENIDILDPTAFKKSVGLRCPRFAGNAQEDAHEFLQELFSQLDADFTKLKEKVGMEVNPITEVFEWTLQNTISCTDCSYESVREDKCRDISVDFLELGKENQSDRNKVDLASLLQHHFKEESVEYKCEKCPSKTAIIRHHIRSSPQVMILHLKRFAFQFQSMSFMKRLDSVQLEGDLDLHRWCLDEGDVIFSEFQLRCIVNHIGSSHNKGHYVADVLDPAVKEWRTYDDSLMIKQHSDMTKERNQTCYLLVYNRLE